MSSKSSTSDRKRKARKEPEVVVNSNDQVRKQSEARKPSTRASRLAAVEIMYGATERATRLNVEHTMFDATERGPTANTASASAPEDEEKIQIVGKLIQSLIHSDKKKVEVSLDALQLDLDEDQKKKEHIQAVGGCHALVQLIRNCLKAVHANVHVKCEQVAELTESAELETLEGVLDVISNLTYQHWDSKVGITAIGGVEAVIKAMTTFPACHSLQLAAAIVLHNLTCCDSGQNEAVNAGAITVLLAAVSNHGDSHSVITEAFETLHSMIVNSKYNTKLFIRCGGSAAVAKVREHWLDQNTEVPTCV